MLVAPRQRVVVVVDGDACPAVLRRVVAHGGRRRQRRRWPEQEHPQVTKQDAAAALEHAPAAQHRTLFRQEITAPRRGAGGRVPFVSRSYAGTPSCVVGQNVGHRGAFIGVWLGF